MIRRTNQLLPLAPLALACAATVATFAAHALAPSLAAAQTSELDRAAARTTIGDIEKYQVKLAYLMRVADGLKANHGTNEEFIAFLDSLGDAARELDARNYGPAEVALEGAEMFIENLVKLDADGDKVPDWRDKCPDEVPNFTAPEAELGCPAFRVGAFTLAYTGLAGAHKLVVKTSSDVITEGRNGVVRGIALPGTYPVTVQTAYGEQTVQITLEAGKRTFVRIE